MASTSRSCINSIGKGNRPDSISKDKSLTLPIVKSGPSIKPTPAVIGDCTLEDINSLSSSSITNKSPVLYISVVTSPKVLAPSELNSIFTIGSPVVWCVLG